MFRGSLGGENKCYEAKKGGGAAQRKRYSNAVDFTLKGAARLV